jgi:Mce-associated membrane protein
VALSPTLDRREGVTDPETNRPDQAPSLLRWGVLAVLGALVVGSLVALGIQAANRDGNPFSTTDDTQTARDDVMSQARRFMVRVNTYGPDLLEGAKMPKYRSGVTALVTAKFGADFKKNVPYAEATVAQAGLARTTEVYAVGVGDLDRDRGRATALVAGSFTNSLPDAQDKTKRVPADPQPYRVQVSLVRQAGTWKVDAFSPVGADPSGQQQPSSPAPSPAGGAQ